jgi:hypothetical protein
VLIVLFDHASPMQVQVKGAHYAAPIDDLVNTIIKALCVKSGASFECSHVPSVLPTDLKQRCRDLPE